MANDDDQTRDKGSSVLVGPHIAPGIRAVVIEDEDGISPGIALEGQMQVAASPSSNGSVASETVGWTKVYEQGYQGINWSRKGNQDLPN